MSWAAPLLDLPKKRGGLFVIFTTFLAQQRFTARLWMRRVAIRYLLFPLLSEEDHVKYLYPGFWNHSFAVRWCLHARKNQRCGVIASNLPLQMCSKWCNLYLLQPRQPQVSRASKSYACARQIDWLLIDNSADPQKEGQLGTCLF